MTRLDIGNMIDPEETAWFCLNEGPLLPGMLGTHYEQVLSTEEAVTETLRISMRGTPAELRALIFRLEEICRQVRLYEEQGLGAPIYLRAFPPDGYDPLYSRLFQAELRAKSGGLALEEYGNLTLDLVITRQNAFDSDEHPLTLNNSAGSGLIAALKNRDDGLATGNDN